MEDATTIVPVLLMGAGQDSQPLPNTVPGIGPADGAAQGATEGQPAGQPGAPGAGTAAPVGPFGGPMIWMLVLLMVFMVASTWMSSRKQKRQAAAMLASLKRGDRVLTAGGMIGTVHEVREDSIVLRVDDVSGAKAHFTRGAIQQVIKSARSDAKSDDGSMAEAG